MLKTLFKCIPTSQLYDEKTFYRDFERCLARARKEIIIESPFLTTRRILPLLPNIQKARTRGVAVVVNTRDPYEHEDFMKYEAEQAVEVLQSVGVVILFTGKLHRKLAIIDRETVWEGSLNILSQNDSCEMMRKTISTSYAYQLMRFIDIEKYLPEANLQLH